jgi:hypothetical protein
VATSDAPTAIAERFEQAFQSACAAGKWRAAVDARVNCAVWAFQNGRRAQSEKFLDEAIAQAHGLPTRALDLEGLYLLG